MGLLFDSYILDVLVALGTLFIVFYMFYMSSSSYWKDRGIPYVEPSIFGGIYSLLGRKPFHELHMDIYNAQPDASVIGYFDLRDPALTIRDPTLVEKVLISDFASFHDHGLPYDLETEPLTGSLFNVEGSYWRNLRYKLTPAFTAGRLKSMFEQMSNCADNLVKHIEEELQLNSGSPFEGKHLIYLFSLDVICTCAFGLEFSNKSDEGRYFRKMVEEVLAPSKGLLWRYIILSVFPKLAKLLNIRNFQPEVSDYFMNITKETINYRRSNGIKRDDFIQLMLTLQDQEQNNKDVRNDSRDDAGEEDAVLDQLKNDPILDNKVPTTKIFTDECLAAQSFSFLTAGSEAVAIVGSYCLYALADNLHVQGKLQKEADCVLKKHKGNLTYETVKEMKYLDQVFYETLRLYPPHALLLRKCNKPFLVPDTKCVIEPGITINIPVYSLHHDEKYFPDPYTFDPERFGEGNTIHRGTFLPFGDGPRICIGMRFAQLEAKVCTARIISTFNVRVNKKTVQPLEFDPVAFFFYPKDGLWLEFERRVKA